MPLYEYTCLKCKERFELLRSHTERDEPAECPECGAEQKHLRVPSLFSSAGGDALSSGGSCGTSSSGFG